MNEKLKEFMGFAKMIKTITGVDAAIGVWDENATVQLFMKSKNFALDFPQGYKIEDEKNAMFKVLKEGVVVNDKLPKEVFGIDIETILSPIFDGNKVVGVTTYTFSSEVKDRINSNISKLSTHMDTTTKSLMGITRGAESLDSNMITIKEIAEDASNKLKEALIVVDEIKQNAKLSNILALNASIESARAGEAGKGFAIVSDEMRKFSKLSSEASEKISDTLGKVTKALNNVRQSVNDSSTIAKEQTESVEKLNDIVNEVNEVSSCLARDCVYFNE